MPATKGKWERTESRSVGMFAPEVELIYRFEAKSGFSAEMKRHESQRAVYRALIYSPDGHIATYVNDQGHNITAMELHLSLRDAKRTVEERVLELEQRYADARN